MYIPLRQFKLHLGISEINKLNISYKSGSAANKFNVNFIIREEISPRVSRRPGGTISHSRLQLRCCSGDDTVSIFNRRV